jgi:hypothetical protein
MLAALSAIPGAKIFCIGQNQRAQEFTRYFGLNAEFHIPITHKEALKKQSQMDLNLYVTLSECAPMLPLESLSEGSPCLFGPNNHYFEDQPYLLSRLMVTYPDRSDIILDAIERSLAERDQIIQRYIQYAPGYNAHARKQLNEFIEMELD